MSRRDFIAANVSIYASIAQALAAQASPDVRIVVVASPANVNAMVLSQHAPSIPAANITALTRLDHNRAVAHVSGRRGEGEQGFALGHAGTRRAPPPPPLVHCC